MNTTIVQQEVLLFTGTSFLRRNWVERENHWYSMVEQLENACWNGMLPELLPEIITDTGAMFVWQVQQCNAFLHVRAISPACACPATVSPARGSNTGAGFPR